MKQRERAGEKEKDYEKDAKGYFAVGSKTLKYVAFNRVSEVINRGRFHVKCLSVCKKIRVYSFTLEYAVSAAIAEYPGVLMGMTIGAVSAV